MSKKYPAIPKGEACRLDLTTEYDEGYRAAKDGCPNDNPYDYFDQYTKCYAWIIGWYKGNNDA